MAKILTDKDKENCFLKQKEDFLKGLSIYEEFNLIEDGFCISAYMYLYDQISSNIDLLLDGLKREGFEILLEKSLCTHTGSSKDVSKIFFLNLFFKQNFILRITFSCSRSTNEGLRLDCFACFKHTEDPSSIIYDHFPLYNIHHLPKQEPFLSTHVLDFKNDSMRQHIKEQANLLSEMLSF